MDTVYVFLVALLGLAVGSFLNVVIYRVPRKRPFVRGRSACPHCGTRLAWYHNIPLLSYLALRGRCAFCKEHISARYPLVESLNAAGYVYLYFALGLSLQAAAFAFLVSALLVIFFVDLDFQIIPDSITLTGMIIGLGASLLPGGLGIRESALGLLIGGGALYLIALLGDWLFKKESMGGGDIKMTAMLGAFLGWQKMLLIFIASALIGLIVSVAAMTVSARLRRERVIPFGPFLALAAILALVWGGPLIRFYAVTFLGLP